MAMFAPNAPPITASLGLNDMTHAQKIRKLANAIREYRGAKTSDMTTWVHLPKPGNIDRVRYALQRLGQNTDENIKLIDGFQRESEFLVWLNTL